MVMALTSSPCAHLRSMRRLMLTRSLAGSGILKKEHFLGPGGCKWVSPSRRSGCGVGLVRGIAVQGEGGVTESGGKEDEVDVVGESEGIIKETDHSLPLSTSSDNMEAALKPAEVVKTLDKYIVGQGEAKRAVAIALRNRWRRRKLGEELRNEVIPRNILMIGPTGCGKTEIARRIAKLSQAPFVKVEATKFTEVGFHGRDVDQIIRDLVEVSINLTKKAKMEEFRGEAQRIVEDRIIDALLGENSGENHEAFRTFYRSGELDERRIDVDIPVDREGIGSAGAIQLDASHAAMNVSELLGRMSKLSGKSPTEKRNMTIKEASPLIEDMELEKLVDITDINKTAIQLVEECGIVFIDEIDKICSSGDYKSADASAEGVQRDLLPLIEGSTIGTKYGNVNTDFILFIASGAFRACKPSQLLAELQGRLPIRVTLDKLSEDDMYRILTEPVPNLIRQHVELLAAEGVDLSFDEEAIREVARVAAAVNKCVENIGARRLHSVLEKVMEDISFSAPDMVGSRLNVTKELVCEKVGDLIEDTDLGRYIL